LRLPNPKMRIYEFVRGFAAEHGYPPSIREIAKGLGYKSTKAIKVHLDGLAAQGLIKRKLGHARAIQIEPWGIPIVGRVPAGIPNLAVEDVEEIFTATRWRRSFMLRVKGDSMIDAGIMEGDLAVVDPNQVPRPGDIVVARLADEATVKRLVMHGDAYALRPENTNYELITGPFKIVGKVLGVIREYV
jgi:repressor LexA